VNFNATNPVLLANKISYITSKAVISVTREHKHSKSQDEEQGRQTKNQVWRWQSSWGWPNVGTAEETFFSLSCSWNASTAHRNGTNLSAWTENWEV